MNHLIELVIGALAALDLTAAFIFPSLPPPIRLNLHPHYVGNDRSFVTLDCNVWGRDSVEITSVNFFKRVPGDGAALYLLTNRDPAAQQVIIMNQTDRSIRFRFSQTQEGYFRCRTPQGDYSSNEVGLAGSVRIS